MGRQNISDNARVDRSVNTGGYSTLAQKGLSGEYELSVLVSGVHCAGCIQKIESRLAKDEAITKARLNFSTGRLVMGWEGDKERADEFVALVENLGYGVKPYDPRTEADETQKQEKFLLLCLGVGQYHADLCGVVERGRRGDGYCHARAVSLALRSHCYSGGTVFRSPVFSLGAEGLARRAYQYGCTDLACSCAGDIHERVGDFQARRACLF